jgi:hypothetical protein
MIIIDNRHEFRLPLHVHNGSLIAHREWHNYALV